jgi:NAD(P)-dependent dehydrogenase (short-subunit alcohol dehydrogenase family)
LEKEDVMKVLVIGGTRFFGVHMVESLLKNGHQVTIATRGNARDEFGDRIERVIVDRTEAGALKNAFQGRYFDAVCDNIAYSSLDVKYLLSALSTFITLSHIFGFSDFQYPRFSVLLNPASARVRVHSNRLLLSKVKVSLIRAKLLSVLPVVGDNFL